MFVYFRYLVNDPFNIYITSQTTILHENMKFVFKLSFEILFFLIQGLIVIISIQELILYATPGTPQPPLLPSLVCTYHIKNLLPYILCIIPYILSLIFTYKQYLAHRIQQPILKLKTPEFSRNILTIYI